MCIYTYMSLCVCVYIYIHEMMNKGESDDEMKITI